MDWNWFFSSVAQSIAALVGIIAAFVITSVVANQAEYSRRLPRAAELVATSRTLVDRFSGRHFSWYNKRRLESALNSVEYRLRKGTQADAKALYTQLNFPRFIPRDEVLPEIEERIRFVQHPPRTAGIGLPYTLISPNVSLSDISDKVDAEGELIGQLVIEAKSHARLVEQFLREVDGNPQDPPLLRFAVAALLALFFVGVIFPLFLLPVSGGQSPQFPVRVAWRLLGSPKGLILTVSSIIFTGICVCFFVVSTRLRYPRAIVNELRHFTDLAAYSIFLGTMVANNAAMATDTPESVEA